MFPSRIAVGFPKSRITLYHLRSYLNFIPALEPAEKDLKKSNLTEDNVDNCTLSVTLNFPFDLK